MGVYWHLGKAHPSGIYSHCLVQGDHCFRCSIHGIKIHEARIVDKELQIRYCCNACRCSCSSTLGNLLCFHPIVNRFARNSLSVTTTIHVAWLEPLIMRRKPQLLEFVFGAVVVYGIYFVSDDFTMDEYVALGLGLLSALLAATFSVFNAKFIQTISATKITLYEMFSAAVFLTIVLVVTGDFNCARITPSISDVLWLLFLGVICTSFAFLANIEVVKRLGAFTVSLSINLEPVYTIVLAIFILNENELLGVDFYIGSTLIVFVVLLNAVLKSSQRKTQNNLSN